MSFDPITTRTDAIPTAQVTFELTDYDGYYTDEVYPVLTFRWHVTKLWTGGEGIIYTDRFDIQVGDGADRGSLKIIRGAGRAFWPYMLPDGAWKIPMDSYPTYFNVVTGTQDLDYTIDASNDLVLTGVPDEWLV